MRRSDFLRARRRRMTSSRGERGGLAEAWPFAEIEGIDGGSVGLRVARVSKLEVRDDKRGLAR